MHEEKISFKFFLSRVWWIFLIAFGHAFSNAQELKLSGSMTGDILISIGVIYVILFGYWFIKYGHKQ